MLILALGTVLMAAAPLAAGPVPSPLAPLRAAADTGFIEVSGNAQVSVPTDRARLVFAVETEAPTSAEAVQANADRMDAVLGAVRGLEVAGLEVETTGFQLHPRYRRPGEGGVQEISGYRALNHVQVTVDDVEAVGRVLDAAVEAGANRVTRLAFEASDTEAARREALRRAVEQARAEAGIMASALGVELGAALEVRGGADRPGPRPMMEMMRADAAGASTPVEPGEQTVSASVTIRYRIGGAP